MKQSQKESPRLRISNVQFFMIIIACTTPFGHFVYIHLAYLEAGRDAWLSLFLGAVIGAVLVYFQFKLVTRRQSGTLTEQTRHVFGPFVSRLIGSFYVLFFLLSSALTVRVLADFMGIILPRTPPYVISVSVLFLCAWLAYAGLEPLARTIQALLPFLMLLGITASILTVHDKQPAQLLPVLEHGFVPVWRGALMFVTMFAEWIVFCMMANETNNPMRVPKQSLLTIVILMMMFIGPVTGPVMLFGEHLASDTSYPTFLEITNIDIADFLQNLDTIGVFLWAIGAFLRISTTLYCASRAIADLVNTDQKRIFTFPAFLLVEAIDRLMKEAFSQWETFAFIMSAYLVITLFCGLLLPLFTYAVGAVRQKLGNPNQPQPDGNP